MNVALIQVNAGKNKKENLQKSCNLIEGAANQGAEFILLPEVFNYRGSMLGKELYNQIAEDIPGESLLPIISILHNTGELM